MDISYTKDITDKYGLIKRYTEIGKAIWIGKTRTYSIDLMDNEHIINAAKLLYRKRKENKNMKGTAEWLYIFSWELAKRGIDIDEKIK